MRYPHPAVKFPLPSPISPSIRSQLIAPGSRADAARRSACDRLDDGLSPANYLNYQSQLPKFSEGLEPNYQNIFVTLCLQLHNGQHHQSYFTFFGEFQF